MAPLKKAAQLRPSTLYCAVLVTLLGLQAAVFFQAAGEAEERGGQEQLVKQAAARYGLSDVCVATEARYIRHLALTDPLAPYMDHPGAIEYFPTGVFWRPLP